MLDIRRYTFEQLLQEKGFLLYTTVGTSMLPLLRERRDIVEIRPLEGRARRLDVVLYRRGGMYILHRVLRVEPEGYLIAGDHNTFVERDVTDAMILGRMTRIIRDGKSVPVSAWRLRLYTLGWCAPWRLRMLLLRAARRLKRLRPGGGQRTEQKGGQKERPAGADSLNRGQ